MDGLLPSIRTAPNGDGTHTLILDFPREEAEFAKEFCQSQDRRNKSTDLKGKILEQAKKFKITSVKILISGVLVATFAFSSLLSAFAANDRYTMGYLYSGTDVQQIEYVNQANNALDTVSPSYFDIQEDGSLKLNYLSSFFIESMHEKGIKVVPFLSNHWNRTAGINALKDVESLSTQLADYIEEYDLDGINVDIENVTHEQRDSYTELVRLLREKIPADKEVSVAVAANPNNWQTGWHGSYDYTALARYADHLVIMAYDEHYEGGEAGPVASMDFVESSIQYALDKTTADKIVIAVPFYGRVWSLDDSRIAGKGVSSKVIQKILADCKATVQYDEASQSVKAEVIVTEADGKYTVGGNFVLQPGRYVVWFENDRSYEEKLGLIEKYDLKGAGAWSLGQEDTSIWDRYEEWVNGDETDAGDPPSATPPQPEPPVLPEPPVPPVDDEAEFEPPTETPFITAYIKRDYTSVSVYQNPNLRGKVIAALSAGETISVRESKPGVYQVRLSDGRMGYLSAAYITFEKEPETPAPVPPSQEYFLHRVQPGETLWKLAQQYLGQGSRYTEIVQLNGLTSDRIYPGMELKIPGASEEPPVKPEASYQEYTDKRGDSLWKIARKYLGSGSRYTEIIEINGLKSETVHPGQILKLPVS